MKADTMSFVLTFLIPFVGAPAGRRAKGSVAPINRIGLRGARDLTRMEQ